MNSEKGIIFETDITEFQTASKVKQTWKGFSEQGIFGKDLLKSKEVPGRLLPPSLGGTLHFL